VAVLGNRGTGLLDMAIEAFKDKSMPNMQLAPTVPGLNTVLRPTPTAQMPAPPQVATVQTNPALNQQPMMQSGQGVRATPQMMQQRTPSMPTGEGVMRPGMDREKMMRDAKVASDVLNTGDESLIERAKGYFGNRENMVRLALAFNSMRLTPDQGLAAALGSEMKTLQENKATTKTQTAVVNWLKANGYEQYVEVALQNPKAAVEIFKQITQKEFAPGKSPNVSGVQYDAENKAYVVVSENGVPKIEYIGTERTDPLELERAKTQWDLSSKRSDEISRKADGIEEQLGLYQQALVQLNNGAESGFVRNMLPAFTKQTAALRSIAQQLGIQTINSATFGALSEKELELALSTNMNLSLDPVELKQQIIEKMEATQKLYLEMRKKAAQLSSMRFDEYNQMMEEEAKANEKFLKKPDGVPQATWYAMTLDQKKRFYEAGDQQ